MFLKRCNALTSLDAGLEGEGGEIPLPKCLSSRGSAFYVGGYRENMVKGVLEEEGGTRGGGGGGKESLGEIETLMSWHGFFFLSKREIFERFAAISQ